MAARETPATRAAQAVGVRTVLLPGRPRSANPNSVNAVPDHPVEPDLRAGRFADVADVADVAVAVDTWRRS